MKKLYDVAVVGAHGLVGSRIIEVLEKREFPISRLLLLSEQCEADKSIVFKGEQTPILPLCSESVIKNRVDFALFCSTPNDAKKFAPLFAALGSTVVDCSLAFRMDENVPLVIPSVNSEEALATSRIIACPSSTSVVAISAIAPLYKKYGVKRIVFNTYHGGTNNEERNVVPFVSELLPNGYTHCEQQLIDECKKILGDRSIAITSTAVSVPIDCGCAISANIELEYSVSPDDVIRTLLEAGIVINAAPTMQSAFGKDEVLAGRIRRDFSHPNTFNLWIVADDILKGVALNSLQILELFL